MVPTLGQRSRDPGVGIIRHMRKTPDGNLAIHQSTNRIGLAIIGKAGSTSSRQ
jgi:hypothetical protein